MILKEEKKVVKLLDVSKNSYLLILFEFMKSYFG